MDTTKLKKFAQYARRTLVELVSDKLQQVLASDSSARRESPQAMRSLESALKKNCEEQLIEQVAYTWFNRFCALRFMDVNGYNQVQVTSPQPGQFQPEILSDAKSSNFYDSLTPAPVQKKVEALLSGTSSSSSSDPQGEAYRLLVVAACNSWFYTMPYLFEKIEDFSELLMPDDLLSGNSILAYTREAMTPALCAVENTDESVEVIGWLYQFYISEKKDQVFAGLKRNQKITAENIPAATQLFTPHWIVRYLVENSLGRLWLLNNPDSKLASKMEYYIAPEEPETDFLKITKPEEIRICDPACGSGHMLTYAFDLLYHIYKEQLYDENEIPVLILTHNLTGVEIDDRAGALAAFALAMKTAAKLGRRRFLRMKAKPDICVLQDVSFSEAEMHDVAAMVGKDLFTDELRQTLGQFEQAKNFGSLIVPKLRDPAEALRVVETLDFAGDLLLKEIQARVVAALRMAEALSPKYHVVVANPPYMGGKGMNGKLGDFAKEKYPDSKVDLFAMFMERAISLMIEQGMMAMINMQSWMFLTSYEKLRANLLEKAPIITLIQIGYNTFPELNSKVAQGAAFVSCKKNESAPGYYFNLNKAPQSANKSHVYLEQLRKIDEYCFRTSVGDLEKVPGTPIAYWLSETSRKAFKEENLSKYSKPLIGMRTGDNSRFLRNWFEISSDKSSIAGSSEPKWFPYAKGGEFRRWYGNNEFFVNWKDDGFELKSATLEVYPQLDWDNLGWKISNEADYFKESITWTCVSTSKFAARFIPVGSLFDTGGSFIPFRKGVKNSELLGYLNSNVAQDFLYLLNPTINYGNGTVGRLPWFDVTDNVTAARELVQLAKSDWDAYETSWDFTTLPLLAPDHRGETLENSYTSLRAHWQSMTDEMKALEEENNRIFIDAYGLQDELPLEVPLNEITLTCNPAYRYGIKNDAEANEIRLRADSVAEFLSYAVGCMMGRYSLDADGLIVASSGETLSDYVARLGEKKKEIGDSGDYTIEDCSFAPDDDAIIPILEGNWFTDDIVERMKEFLKVTFGSENYEENLRYLEDGLYPSNLEGKKRKGIREYFLKDFYNKHVQTYKKRPIYWLFSSPKGSFNALVYLHRYKADTVSVVLNDYLREFKEKLSAKLDNLQHLETSADASKKDIANALKEIAKIKKVLTELNDWERDVLFPLAQQQIDLDLDDGVKVNYNKFKTDKGLALKKVTGLTGK